MPQKISLTEEQKKFIADNWDTMTAKKIARELNLDYKKVYGYIAWRTKDKPKHKEKKTYQGPKVNADGEELFDINLQEDWFVGGPRL